MRSVCLHRAISGTFNLFFQKKFGIHRITGLSWLLMYFYVIPLFFLDYQSFLKSPIIIAMPLIGVLQSIIAVRTFTFLPKRQSNPGYYEGVGTMSYPFIQENIFFSSLLAFQWV